MEIKYKLFPYPVLSYMNDDYVDSHFESDVSISHNPGMINVVASFTLDNDGLNTLIKNGTAEFVLHIECSQTSFREIRKANTHEIRTRIPESKLNGKVNICSFIVAKTDISGYQNEFFNTDYGALSFRIEKGSVMAFTTQTNVYIDKETEELSKISSIFLIMKKQAIDIEPIEVNLDSEKIMIKLREDEYYAYQKIVKRYDLLNASHAMLIFPVLVYALDRILESGSGYYDDYRWFRVIKKRLNGHGIELGDSMVHKADAFHLAQLLLSMPINRALTALSFSQQEEVE